MEHVIEETVVQQQQQLRISTTTQNVVSPQSPQPQPQPSSASSFYSAALSFFPSLSSTLSSSPASSTSSSSSFSSQNPLSSSSPAVPSSFSAPSSLHSSLDNLSEPVPIVPRSLRPPSPSPTLFNSDVHSVGASPQLSPLGSPISSPSSSPPSNFSTLYSFEQNDTALLTPNRSSVSSPVVSFSTTNLEEEYWAFFTTVAQLPYIRRKAPAPPTPTRTSIVPTPVPAESGLTSLIQDFSSSSLSPNPTLASSPSTLSPTPSPRKLSLPEIIQTSPVGGPSSAPLGTVNIDLGVSPSSLPPIGYVPYSPMPNGSTNGGNGSVRKYSAPPPPSSGATPLIIAPPPIYQKSNAPRGYTTFQIHSCLYKRKGEKGYSLTQKAATALLRRYIGLKSDLPSHSSLMDIFRVRVAPFFDAFSPKTSKLLKVYILSHVFTVTAENDACGHMRFEISIPDEDILEYVEHQRQLQEALKYNQDKEENEDEEDEGDQDSSSSSDEASAFPSTKQAVEAKAVGADPTDLLIFDKQASSSSSPPSSPPLPSSTPTPIPSASSPFMPHLEANSLSLSSNSFTPTTPTPQEIELTSFSSKKKVDSKRKEKRKKKKKLPVSTPKSYYWLELQVNNPYKNQFFPARIQLLMKEGLSVISDIDDTIKESGVLHKKDLMRNTFIKSYVPVEGMANLYRSWEQRYGCSFHYVSASPWGLHSPLNEFISKFNFPEGTFHLRQWGWNDSSFLDMFSSSQLRLLKYTAIQTLFQQFPFRHFLLVGDSGESDPEIYGEIARQFPGQVAGIFIRELNRVQPRVNRERECAAWFHLPLELCHIFHTPEQLASWRLDGRIAAHLFQQPSSPTPTQQSFATSPPHPSSSPPPPYLPPVVSPPHLPTAVLSQV